MGLFLKLFITLIFIILGPINAMAKSVYGTLVVVKGKVQVKSFKSKTTKKARVGEKIFPQDIIITQEESRAKIVMIDKNEINISPSSQIEIADYEYDPENNKKNVLLNVIYGKVRNKVKQKYDNKSSQFKVKTPSAVAGVRGTDFFTSYNPVNQATRVITFEGQVSFGLPGAGGEILNAVDVNPGQVTENFLNRPPSAPTELPKQEFAELDRDSRADSGDPRSSSQDREPANRPPRNNSDSGTKIKGPKGASAPGTTLPGGINSDDSDKKRNRQTDSYISNTPINAIDSEKRDPANFDKGPGRTLDQNMIRPEDMPTFAGGNIIPDFDTRTPTMIQPDDFLKGPINRCDFCEELTKDGMTRLIVNPVK